MPDARPGVRLDRILDASADAGALRELLRTPLASRAEPVANRHVAGQIDTVTTWVYDGLVLELYEVADGRALVQRLAVTSGSYGTRDGLSVGESRADLESVLGPPQSPGRVATYLRGDPLATTIRVTYDPDPDGAERASEIEWRPPVE